MIDWLALAVQLILLFIFYKRFEIVVKPFRIQNDRYNSSFFSFVRVIHSRFYNLSLIHIYFVIKSICLQHCKCLIDRIKMWRIYVIEFSNVLNG